MAKKPRDIVNSTRNTNDTITRVATDIPDHGVADDAISIVSIVCRICFDDNKEEPIITPCLCKGSVAFVHTSCLEKWLAESNTSSCELCHHVYETEKVPRYSAKQSVWQWLRHQRQSPPIGPGAPAHAAQLRTRQIRCDLIACAILTPLAIIVTYICLFSADYYNQQRYASAPTARWTSLSLLVLIAIMLFGYYLWVYVVVGYHGRMWYYWWQREWVVRYIQPTAVVAAAAQHTARGGSGAGSGGGVAGRENTTSTVVQLQGQGGRASEPWPTGQQSTGVGIRVPFSDVDRLPVVTRGNSVPEIHEVHHQPANVLPSQQDLSPVHEEHNAVHQQTCVLDLNDQPVTDDECIKSKDDPGEQQRIIVDTGTYCGEYYHPDESRLQLDPNTSPIISYSIGYYKNAEGVDYQHSDDNVDLVQTVKRTDDDDDSLK